MDAVTLLVGDLDAQTAFYRDVVTLEVQDAAGDTVTLGRAGRPLVILRHEPALRHAPAGSAGLFHTAILFETQAALAAGFRLRDTFTAVRAIAARVDVPILVMTYWNPVMQYGVDRFADDLLAAGGAGLITPDITPDAAADAELIDLVTAELGSDWPRLVAPSFDARKAVLLDDRWASAREDLVKIWLMDDDEIDANWAHLSERFEGAGHVVGTQATYWQGKALAAGRTVHASLYARAAAGAENPGKGRYSDEVAVVTGASKGSIAASVAAQLLAGGATVIATTSKLDDSRLAFYRDLWNAT